MHMSSWPALLHDRELGAVRALPELPRPNNGVLVLDGSTTPKTYPRMLDLVNPPVHYLDLGAVPAASLLHYGGSDEFWSGIKKLYASHCGLSSIDGIAKLTGVVYLYLDNNELSEEQLLKLCTALPQGQLRALDVAGNPGCSDVVPQALLNSGVLAGCEFLNGQRLRDLS